MEPGPSAADDPVSLMLQERNAFFHSLAPAARDNFLRALQEAKTRGLNDEIAWKEAVIAAETTYGDSL